MLLWGISRRGFAFSPRFKAVFWKNRDENGKPHRKRAHLGGRTARKALMVKLPTPSGSLGRTRGPSGRPRCTFGGSGCTYRKPGVPIVSL